MSSQHRPLTIAVVGGSGSGKTTVSQAILHRVGNQHIALIPHDAYYKDKPEIPLTPTGELNYDHPNALETSLMVEHIRQLQNNQAVNIPVYDFTFYRRTEDVLHIAPQPIILIEGILVLAEPSLRDLCDIKIFVDIDADIRFIRRLQRDLVERGRTVDSVINQYMSTVRPMHFEFVEPSKRYADIIIPEGGHNIVAMDMVAARVKSMLGETAP